MSDPAACGPLIQVRCRVLTETAFIARSGTMPIWNAICHEHLRSEPMHSRIVAITLLLSLMAAPLLAQSDESTNRRSSNPDANFQAPDANFQAPTAQAAQPSWVRNGWMWVGFALVGTGASLEIVG